MADVSEALKSEFETRGYIILRGIVGPETVAAVRGEMEKLVEEQAQRLVAAGKIPHGYADEPFETRLYKLYQHDVQSAPKRFRENLQLAGTYDLFFNARLLDVVELFLGDEIRLYPNYTVRPKFPEWAGHRVNWHQDGGYTAGGDTGVNELRMVNVWTSLVPATVENGCMQFIPGTHRLGVVPHIQDQHYLEIAPDHLQPRLAEAVDVVTEPGDVVLFHNLLFHQGLPNRSQGVRWSLDWRYQDATQGTMRKHQGHIARSHVDPQSAVASADQWAQCTFR